MSAKTLPARSETELMNRFMDEHGDDVQEWSQQTAQDYAAKLEALWAQELMAAASLHDLTSKKASI